MPHNASYTYLFFFWILKVLSKWSLVQILVCYMTNIFNMFKSLNAGDWKLITGTFMTLLKLQWSENLQFFNIWQIAFLIVSYPSFQKIKHWTLDIIGYWVIGVSCWIEMDLEHTHSPPNCSKNSSKLLPLLISINCISLMS